MRFDTLVGGIDKTLCTAFHLQYEDMITAIHKHLKVCFKVQFIINQTWQPNFMINVTILTLLSSTIPFSTVTSRHLLHMVFTSRSWFDIREPVILIGIW